MNQNLLGQNAQNDSIFIKREVQTEKLEIDTIIIKGGISPVQPQVIIGTQFLPNTDKLTGLLNKGLTPISLAIIEQCDDSFNPASFNEYPKFQNIQRDSNILLIDVAVVANCCHNFLGEAEVIGTDKLNLIYTAYGGFCSCTCCFTLRYKFNTTMESHYQILKSVVINNSKQMGKIPKPDRS